jgi:DNA invertase Pin-like site-specific DNA recombinase
VSGLLIGYARVSTDEQDLTAQRDALTALGVAPERIYVDHGLAGTNRARPGLREAMAACRGGDVLVVTKLDRLARSLPDARDIVAELTARDVALSLGGSVHDPTDPVGRLLYNVLAMVAEFESDLIKMRTREGMKVARAKGRQGRTSGSGWSGCACTLDRPGSSTAASPARKVATRSRSRCGRWPVTAARTRSSHPTQSRS